MRRGRRLALDIGTVRIGVALSDSEGILATPLPPLAREANPLDEIAKLTLENQVIEIYIGNPISLAGSQTKSTEDALGFASELAERQEAEIRLVDERLTTVSAANKLRSAGMNAKSSKALIDSASAVEILEIALDFEKRNSVPAGELVEKKHG